MADVFERTQPEQSFESGMDEAIKNLSARIAKNGETIDNDGIHFYRMQLALTLGQERRLVEQQMENANNMSKILQTACSNLNLAHANRVVDTNTTAKMKDGQTMDFAALALDRIWNFDEVSGLYATNKSFRDAIDAYILKTYSKSE